MIQLRCERARVLKHVQYKVTIRDYVSINTGLKGEKLREQHKELRRDKESLAVSLQTQRGGRWKLNGEGAAGRTRKRVGGSHCIATLSTLLLSRSS